MSSRESRAVFRGSARRRRWSKESPPNMSDLRIVLLGKSVSENSGVGNFLLGQAAFDSEAPPDVVERVRGRLKDRHVTIINSPQLLQTNISDHQITQTVRECVSLSDPGPHAFILVLQYNDFTEEDMRRVKHVLEEFSEEAIKRTIELTTDEEKLRAKGASVKANEFIQQLTEECGGGHVQLDHEIKRQFSGILLQLEKILRENNEEFLTCELYYDAEETLEDEDLSRTFASLRTEEDSEGGVGVTRQQKLNLVLCGSDETLKNSVSKLIREKKDVDLHGHVISLVELPALFNTRLSEEEVMRQTLRCVSLCDPGVHVFLLIIPDPLNNEDRAEMEEIQRIFSSRINKHIMILIMQNSEHQTAELNEETQSVIESFGGRHHFFGPTTQVSTLMENIEQMLEENRGEFFSTESFLEAQMKKLLQFEEMKEKTHLQSQGYGTEMEGANIMFNQHLNVVLLGKTRAGKSASGNTILGRQAFISENSSRSVTRDVAGESGTVDGFPVTVYDTPGLFNTHMSDEEIQQKLEKVLQRCESGLCVFLLVSKADRFTEEERETVEKIEELLGPKRLEKTWILFTGGDKLEEENMTIKEFIIESEPLKKLVQKCDQRYHVFTNKKRGHTVQVKMLLTKILRTYIDTMEGAETLKQIPLKRKIPKDFGPDTSVSSLSSRRIVLLGKSAAGKSASGNTILGQKEFVSIRSTKSVTSESSEKHATVSGRSVSVVDTPGFFHTEMNSDESMVKMMRGVYVSSPGPHAFLFVFRVNDRVTEQDQQIPQIIEILFGEEVLKYSIILFTHGDQLEEKTIEKLIQQNCRLRDLVDQCGGRFHVFNNRDENNRDQVNDLLKKIDTMIEENGGGHYSNEMLEDAQRFRREEEEERQREEEEQKPSYRCVSS